MFRRSSVTWSIPPSAWTPLVCGPGVAVDLQVHDAPVLDAGRAAARELNRVVVSGDVHHRRGAAAEGADQAGAVEADAGVVVGDEGIAAAEEDALAAGDVVVDRGVEVAARQHRGARRAAARSGDRLRVAYAECIGGKHRIRIGDGDLHALRRRRCSVEHGQAHGVGAGRFEHVRRHRAGRLVAAQVGHARRAGPGAARRVAEVPAVLELMERPVGRGGRGGRGIEENVERRDARCAAGDERWHDIPGGGDRDGRALRGAATCPGAVQGIARRR